MTLCGARTRGRKKEDSNAKNGEKIGGATGTVLRGEATMMEKGRRGGIETPLEERPKSDHVL